MGLDKDDNTPPVDFSRRTTQVNIWMVVAILVFFAVAGVMVWSLWPEPATQGATVP